MKKLSQDEALRCINSKPVAVIHVDADWDVYRLPVQTQIDSIRQQFESDVAFGYVDCDDEQEFARLIPILNTPTVIYYRKGELVAAVIGVNQDIANNIETVKNGGSPDSSNRIARF